MKSVTGAAALLGILVLSATAAAQHPQPQSSYPMPGSASTYPSPQASSGVPSSGYSGSDCHQGVHGGYDGFNCEPWKEPGYCKQLYYKCMARIHACFAKHHQVQSPVFRSHPFARSPRDYFMYD